MSLANASGELSFRDLAIQAATTAKLSSFSRASDVNPDHTNKINASVAKTYPTLSRFANLCNPTVVKQFAFIMPSFKMAVMSCPFPTQGKNNEEVFAGILGDSMEILCPITISMQDVRGEVLSICETRAEVDAHQLPTSTTNPLEEEAPPRAEDDDEDFVVIAAGPDRIGIQLNVATKEPCFVAVPKVLPVTSGEIQFADFSNTTSIVTTPAMPDILPASLGGVWYEALRYGIRLLDNYSIQERDVLFVYDGIEKDEFTAVNRSLVPRFTTVVTYLTPEDELYHTVIKHVLTEKEKAMMIYGAKIVEANPPLAVAPAHATLAAVPTTGAQPPAPIPTTTDPGITALLDGLAKAISDSSSKTLTGTEREKASEAEDAKRFYSILFGRVCDVTDEDGTKSPTFIHAPIHPLFIPVLTANKNSKATKAMHEAVETMASELSMQDNSYACSSNLFPRMFDQPLTAAIRSGQWEYQHTVLNPEGIKTNFGLHHLAPPRTWTATYITRQQGELQLTQQEQVEEDKSRYNAKMTELYHLGCMGTINDIHEMVGNLYGLMCVIIEFDSANPPLIWTEIIKYMQILRSSDGKLFAGRHRNIKEVMFNIGQDIQSTIAGFVSEARKTSYKTALKAGTAISPRIFESAQSQASELRSRFTLAVLSASAGTYKDTSVVFKLFQPEPTQEETNKKKREAGGDSNHSSPQARNRPFTSGSNRQTGSPSSTPNNVTPNGSPQAAAPPGKTVFVHASPAPQRLPHPGAIFPHPTRANQFTILCCRSAFDGRSCSIPTCAFYHFPGQLTQVPRELKEKLKDWVAYHHELVSWHADALNWANQSGNTRSSS
jgi:hypothetical protein